MLNSNQESKQKRVLTLAHSAGDSNAIDAVNQELVKKGAKVACLLVGQVARDKFTSKEPTQGVTIIDLDTILPDKNPVEGKVNQLEVDDIPTVLGYVGEVDAVLSGTPSETKDKQTIISLQVLQKYCGQEGITTAIFDDYLFAEPRRQVYQRLQKRSLNPDKIFVPFEVAKALLPEHLQDRAIALGHPSLDDAKRRYQAEFASGDKKTQVRDALGVQSGQKLVFIAGGKEGDEALIEAVVSVVKSKPGIQVRIALHPGASREHKEKIQHLASECAQVSVIQDVDNTDACLAADAVLAKESSMVAQAGVCGIDAAYYGGENNFYAAQQGEDAVARHLTTPEELQLFFAQVVEEKRPWTACVDKEGDSAEQIAEQLLTTTMG